MSNLHVLLDATGVSLPLKTYRIILKTIRETHKHLEGFERTYVHTLLAFQQNFTFNSPTTQKDFKLMAKKQNRFDWTFVNIELTNEERKHFEGYYSQVFEDLPALIEDILTQGYKLSLTRDSIRDVWLATLTATKEASYNQSSSMTSRHTELYAAMALAVYKHQVLSQNRDWRDDTDKVRWG